MEKSSRAMPDPSTSSPTSPATRRRASYRALESPSPRSAAVSFSLEPLCEEEPRHFLDACHLCQRPLGRSRDIFMYRGDTPFCSEECRQEQIELDQAREDEAAGYWRNRRRRHRLGEAGTVAAQVQGTPARATEAAVAS